MGNQQSLSVKTDAPRYSMNISPSPASSILPRKGQSRLEMTAPEVIMSHEDNEGFVMVGLQRRGGQQGENEPRLQQQQTVDGGQGYLQYQRRELLASSGSLPPEYLQDQQGIINSGSPRSPDSLVGTRRNRLPLNQHNFLSQSVPGGRKTAVVKPQVYPPLTPVTDLKPKRRHTSSTSASNSSLEEDLRKIPQPTAICSQVSRTESDIADMPEAELGAAFQGAMEASHSRNNVPLVERGKSEHSYTGGERASGVRHQHLSHSYSHDEPNARHPDSATCRCVTVCGHTTHCSAHLHNSHTFPTPEASNASQNAGHSIGLNSDSIQHHSMVFGSRASEGNSMVFGTKNFSPMATRDFVSCQQCMSAETGSFSGTSSHDYVSNNSSDFNPACRGGVTAGKCGVFDSLSDDEHQSLSRECQESRGSHSAESSSSANEAEVTEDETLVEMVQESQGNRNNMPECVHPTSVPSDPQPLVASPRQAVSSCESCALDPHLTTTFGGRSNMCSSCGHQPPSVGAETNSFEVSSYKSRDSADSWSGTSDRFDNAGALALQPPVSNQHINTCFDDYDSDDIDQPYGIAPAKTAESSDSLRNSIEARQTDHQSPNSVSRHIYGGFQCGPYHHITQSQFAAYGGICGYDTGRFGDDECSTEDPPKSAGRMEVANESTSISSTGKQGCFGSGWNAQVSTETEFQRKSDFNLEDENKCGETGEFYPHFDFTPQETSSRFARSGHEEQATGLLSRVHGHDASKLHKSSHNNNDKRKGRKEKTKKKVQEDECLINNFGDAMDSIDMREVDEDSVDMQLRAQGGPGRLTARMETPIRPGGANISGHPNRRNEDSSNDSRMKGSAPAAGERNSVVMGPESQTEEEKRGEVQEDTDRGTQNNRRQDEPVLRALYRTNQYYVAYLCCAPEDVGPFGLSFHHQLEEWGFKIFFEPRDLELAGPKYDNMAKAIEDRCNGKIIVVLSQNYLQSGECLFVTYFARTLDPDSRKRNIIPVMIDKNVELINILKGLSIIKYNHDYKCGWLKRKLVDAIAA